MGVPPKLAKAITNKRQEMMENGTQLIDYEYKK